MHPKIIFVVIVKILVFTRYKETSANMIYKFPFIIICD